MTSKVIQYLDELKKVSWFSKVGNKDINYEVPFDTVDSWGKAVIWSKHEITSWCNIEAGNLLSQSIRLNAPNKFSQWNNIAKSNLPIIQKFIETSISQYIPNEYKKDIELYIQSQLISAIMEIEYSDCSDINILQKMMDLYRDGHFPCGFYVKEPDDFPSNITYVIY